MSLEIRSQIPSKRTFAAVALAQLVARYVLTAELEKITSAAVADGEVPPGSLLNVIPSGIMWQLPEGYGRQGVTVSQPVAGVTRTLTRGKRATTRKV
jgi:hypothetical protein